MRTESIHFTTGDGVTCGCSPGRVTSSPNSAGEWNTRSPIASIGDSPYAQAPRQPSATARKPEASRKTLITIGVCATGEG